MSSSGHYLALSIFSVKKLLFLVPLEATLLRYKYSIEKFASKMRWKYRYANFKLQSVKPFLNTNVYIFRVVHRHFGDDFNKWGSKCSR